MRVLIFTNAYKPVISGVVTSISLFRQELIHMGHDVYIIAPEYEDYHDEELYIFRFPALDVSDQAGLSLVIPSRLTMYPTVRGLKPDLIHSQHPIWMGDIAANFAQDMDLPLVFTFHSRYDIYAKKYAPAVSKLAGMVTDEIIKRYLDKCTHVIAPTGGIRDFILREYALEAPVSVAPTPVDLSQYQDLEPQRIRKGLGLTNAEVLLYIGRLSEEKDIEFLLEVLALIADERPRAHLVLVGKGPEEQPLKRLAQKLGLAQQVIFVGATPHEAVPHYAAMADLFVFPSQADTQGLVLIEAMAAGTPVVAVEALGSADVLAEGGGVLVPPVEEAFARAVVTLLSDDDRRHQFGEQALRSAQRYTAPTSAARLQSIYEAAISAGPRCTRKNLSETWREIGDQFRTFSEDVSAIFRTSAGVEGAKRQWPDVRSRLLTLIDEMDLALLAELEKKRLER